MKKTVFTVTGSVVFFGIIITLFIIKKPTVSTTQTIQNNVTIEHNVQYITVLAKAGYTPHITVAKAHTPTVLKVITSNTYDCSIGLAIPSIRYRKNLQPSGEEDIQLGSFTSGTTLWGVCSMGMYSFSIIFN